MMRRVVTVSDVTGSTNIISPETRELSSLVNPGKEILQWVPDNQEDDLTQSP